LTVPIFPMPSYQTIFLVISLLCALPVLYWYYRRHPHPRFRPRFGEMVMVSLLAGLFCLGGSLLIGGLMDDPDQFRPSASMGSVVQPSASSQGSAVLGADDRRDGKKEESGRRERSGREPESRDSR